MIRIVWGTGTAKTSSSSFDSALVEANVHQYNLRYLSSVIPAATQIEAVGVAPDLGPTGDALNVAIARQTSEPGARAVAGIAWARGGPEGPGVFSEVADTDPKTVRGQLEEGIKKSCALRDIRDPDIEKQVVTAEPSKGKYTTAVVLAVYGESESLHC